MFNQQYILDMRLDIPAELGYQMAMLADTEGSFVIDIHKDSKGIICMFQVTLRGDDFDFLEYFRKGLGNIGHFNFYPKRNGRNSQVAWRVRKGVENLYVLVPLFDKYPLRSRKRQDYELWRRVVLLLAGRQHLMPEGRAEIERLKEEMETGRHYCNDHTSSSQSPEQYKA